MPDDFIISDEEIKRFNAKINRYARKGADYLPEKLSRSDINKMSEEEQSYLKQDIDDFLKRSSMRIDKASGASKYFKDTYNKLFEALETKKAALSEKGGGDTKSGTMGAMNKLNLRPRKNRFDTMTTKERLKSLQGIISQLNKDPEEYKSNYISALKTMFGEGSLEYDLIKNIVDNISGEELYLLYGADADLQIDVIYNQGLSAETKVTSIIDAFYNLGYIEEKPDYYEELINKVKEMYDI